MFDFVFTIKYIDVEFHCKMRQNTFEDTKQHKGYVLFQLNYLPKHFLRFFFQFLFASFSLQILRFVYSLYLEFFFFICLQFYVVNSRCSKWKRERERQMLENQWAIYWLLKRTWHNSFTRNYKQFSFISSLYISKSNALCNLLFYYYG